MHLAWYILGFDISCLYVTFIFLHIPTVQPTITLQMHNRGRFMTHAINDMIIERYEYERVIVCRVCRVHNIS